MAEVDKKRLLVSRDIRTDVWTDDQGDQWTRYFKEESRYVAGAWLVYRRGNNYEMDFLSVHSDELEARRLAMRNRSVSAEVLFVAWDAEIHDPSVSETSGVQANGGDRG